MSADVIQLQPHQPVSDLVLYLALMLILLPWLIYRAAYDTVVADMAWRRRDPDGFIRDVERARWQRAEVARLLKETA
jgi:hypothetical protein